MSPVYRLVASRDGTLAAATEDAGVWIRTPGGAWSAIGLADAPVFALSSSTTATCSPARAAAV